MAVFYLVRKGSQIVVCATSSDTKPNVANGASLIEIDTGDIYYRTGGVWVIVNNGGGGGSPFTPTFLTETDETGDLPNSRRVLAGTRVNFDDSIANVRTISADGITQITGDATAGPGSGSQALTLAASGVTPGTYGDNTHTVQVTVDSKGRITSISEVAITGGGINYVPLALGTEPLTFVSDGAGNPILIPYTP